MKNGEKPIANPYVVLREEFDDWAVLFNPDTGRGFGLSPTGVYLWKLLDGEHTIEALLKMIHGQAEGVPEEAGDHIGTFIDVLVKEGLAGFDSTGLGLPAGVKRPESFLSPPSGHVPELKSFKYEPPKLIDLSGGRHVAYGGSCGPGSFASNNCDPTGHSAGGICLPGTSANSYCYANGTAVVWHTNCLSGSLNSAECNYGTGASGYCDTGSGT